MSKKNLIFISLIFLSGCFSPKKTHSIYINNRFISCNVNLPWNYNFIQETYKHAIDIDFKNTFRYNDTLQNAFIEIVYTPPGPVDFSKPPESWIFFEKQYERMNPIILNKKIDLNAQKFSINYILDAGANLKVCIAQLGIVREEGTFSVKFTRKIKDDEIDYNEIIAELNDLNKIEVEIFEVKKILKKIIQENKKSLEEENN